MDGTGLLRGQMESMHGILEAAIGDCPNEVLLTKLPGSTISSIAAIYAHTVFGEDGLLNGLARGTTPVYQSEGWAETIGLEMPQGGLEPDWDVKYDLGLFRSYAAAVYQSTDGYLASASDAEFDRVVDLGFAPPMPIKAFIGNVLLWHVATHQGEISALKGARGINGLVFSH
ncbi:MAG TPA: DinB family protein [Tepidiformaceae bacterium]|nr:DinB family protein [Tepidiformaceae bacterium]